MIELYACRPMSARITEAQCATNRAAAHRCCQSCPGLGEMVAQIDQAPQARPGTPSREKPKPRPRVPRGDRIVDPAFDASELETPIRFIQIDLTCDDDVALIARIEACACQHGTTLGDEILTRLSVIEGLL